MPASTIRAWRNGREAAIEPLAVDAEIWRARMRRRRLGNGGRSTQGVAVTISSERAFALVCTGGFTRPSRCARLEGPWTGLGDPRVSERRVIATTAHKAGADTHANSPSCPPLPRLRESPATRVTHEIVSPVTTQLGRADREIMLERQREGVQRAKREGKYKGRAPTARAKAAEIVKLAGEGVKREEIASRLGVGIASVYRVLAERKAEALAKRAA